MNSNITFKGTRWYKCDLHLHTTASECFQDKNVSADQWIEKAIEEGLNCVAVTDHNTSLGIDSILEASKEKNITVFPGVEITCDTSKIHILVLFDKNKTSRDVSDFLVRADIKRDDFGKRDAFTRKTIFEIAELAEKDGALIIPAHIDEFNGLGSVSSSNLKDFYEKSINAVQIVHQDFLDTQLVISDNEELINRINIFPSSTIDETTIKQWFKPVKYAVENKLALLTFSDNPHEPNNSKHGLWGIGKSYSWIKMDETPSLEGLRQAFLLPEFRIKNMFDSPNLPYEYPKIWIKSITILNTLISEPEIPLKIEFSPQLNTIIGGRGSGKSSILRFIRGVFNKTSDIEQLEDIIKDHHEFYKRPDRRKKGVININSKIEIEIIRNDILHIVSVENIINSNEQDIEIKKWNEVKSEFEIIESEGYLSFFEFDNYSQKQIYEIAQEPNALRIRIDKSVNEVEEIINDREVTKRSFLEISTSIRTKNQIIAEKGVLETKLKDIEEDIDKLQKSGIAELLSQKENFLKEEAEINRFKEELENRISNIELLITELNVDDIDYTSFEKTHKELIEPISKKAIDSISEIKDKIGLIQKEVEQTKTTFENEIQSSEWKLNYTKNLTEFEAMKVKLEEEGIKDIENFEKLTEEKDELKLKLGVIAKSILERDKELHERLELQEKYILLNKRITRKRSDFVNEILEDNKVKIKIKPFRDKYDFEQKLRNVLKTDKFVKDIDSLIDFVFNGNVERKIKDFRELILKIRKDENINECELTGYFSNLIKDLTDAQIDELELLIPEDEIEVLYKPTEQSSFKPLSTASAGQKTTAILTYILSYGNTPLILDQPEDDLDNKLVYDLVVDRLKQAKNNRQLILVTHNANIPVNADAEYIISMDTESKKLKINTEGTVEQVEIKNEIRNVMEGGEEAFEMRAKRYRRI